jgi:hypothetical protein
MSDVAAGHDLQPDERAPRWERIKRNVVMMATTLISIVLAATVTLSATWLVTGSLTGGPLLVVPILVLAALFDLKLFGWCLYTFDIVFPKEFREAADDGC